MERYWTELLWMISNGSVVEMEALRGTEVLDFFRLYKTYVDNLQKRHGKNNS